MPKGFRRFAQEAETPKADRRGFFSNTPKGFFPFNVLDEDDDEYDEEDDNYLLSSSCPPQHQHHDTCRNHPTRKSDMNSSRSRSPEECDDSVIRSDRCMQDSITLHWPEPQRCISLSVEYQLEIKVERGLLDDEFHIAYSGWFAVYQSYFQF